MNWIAGWVAQVYSISVGQQLRPRHTIPKLILNGYPNRTNFKVFSFSLFIVYLFIFIYKFVLIYICKYMWVSSGQCDTSCKQLRLDSHKRGSRRKVRVMLLIAMVVGRRLVCFIFICLRFISWQDLRSYQDSY